MVSKTLSILGVLVATVLMVQPAMAADKSAKKGRFPASISPGSSVAVPDPLDLSHMKPAWFTSSKMPALLSSANNPALHPVVLGGKYSLFDDTGTSVLSPRRNPYSNGTFWLH